MNTNSALNTLPQTDPRFRELRIGDFGYLLADLETKTVHISNMFVKDQPAQIGRVTTQDFGIFCLHAQMLFEGEALLKVVGEGLLIFSGHFDGTF